MTTTTIITSTSTIVADESTTNDPNHHHWSFQFRIPLIDSENNEEEEKASTTADTANEELPSVPLELQETFHKDGFVVIPNVISVEAVDALNDRLEDVLRGHYDRGSKPDKTPRLLKSSKPPIANSRTASNTDNRDNDNEEGSSSNQTNNNNDHSHNENRTGKKKKKLKGRKPPGPIGFSGNLQNVKVLQIINIHKADSLFRRFETHSYLGHVVSEITGWGKRYGGVRLAQDQIWAKPPGAPPLVFHRDSPYFMFEPTDVVTVWVALDDMDIELGPLEYVKSSHLWGDGRIGSANQFFQSNASQLLRSAAEREGLNPDTDLDIISMAGLKAGSISIHHGKIWHGSNKNNSMNRPRRGLGLHFVPGNVKFTADASHSKLWKRYVIDDMENPSLVNLSEEDFPTVA